MAEEKDKYFDGYFEPIYGKKPDDDENLRKYWSELEKFAKKTDRRRRLNSQEEQCLAELKKAKGDKEDKAVTSLTAEEAYKIRRRFAIAFIMFMPKFLLSEQSKRIKSYVENAYENGKSIGEIAKEAQNTCGYDEFGNKIEKKDKGEKKDGEQKEDDKSEEEEFQPKPTIWGKIKAAFKGKDKNGKEYTGVIVEKQNNPTNSTQDKEQSNNGEELGS